MMLTAGNITPIAIVPDVPKPPPPPAGAAAAGAVDDDADLEEDAVA